MTVEVLKVCMSNIYFTLGPGHFLYVRKNVSQNNDFRRSLLEKGNKHTKIII